MEVVACVIIYFGEFVISSIFLTIYYLFLSVKNRSPAARRRREKQMGKQHRFQHQPISQIGSDLTKISRPPKAYQIFRIDADRETNSNKINGKYSPLETTSSVISNSIELEMIKRATPNNRTTSIKTKDDSRKSENLSHTNRSRSIITVARVSNTKRYRSTSNNRKKRQSRSSNVTVTRVKK